MGGPSPHDGASTRVVVSILCVVGVLSLLFSVPPPVAAEPPPVAATLASGVLMPFGTAAARIDPGVTAGVLGRLRLPGWPVVLAVHGGVARHPVVGADWLLTLDGTGGIGVEPVVGSLRLGAYLLGGYGYSNLSGTAVGTLSDGNVVLRGQVAAGMNLGPVGIVIRGGYFRSFSLLDGVEFGLGITYPPSSSGRAPRDRPDAPAPDQPPLDLVDDGAEPASPALDAPTGSLEAVIAAGGPVASELVQAEASSGGLRVRTCCFSPVFPVFSAYYEAQGFGALELTNESRQDIERLTATVFIDRIMDVPSSIPCPTVLPAGETVVLPVTALFSAGILDITEASRMAMDVQVQFERRGRDRDVRLTDVVDVRDRNAVIWDDDRKVASFVTSRDPDVLRLSRQAAAVMRSRGAQAVQEELRAAIALFDVVRSAGVTYVVDPTSPYAELSGDPVAVDYVQFPRQTIEYRAGDCDDLSILYAALAESIGIESAFVTVPGHIYTALRLPMTPEAARRTFSRPDELIFIDDTTWLPVENTALNRSFLEAWQLGARQWREHAERAAVHPVRSAWEAYPPVGLAGDARAAPPDLSADLAARYEQDLMAVVDREIYPQLSRLRTQYEESGHVRYRNRIAVVYARYGLYARAREECGAVLEVDPANLPALVNLGNIDFLEDHLMEAVSHYDAALALRGEYPTALLGAARSHHALENYGFVGRYFDVLREVDPGLAERFGYLDYRGDEGTRAAEAAGVSNVVVWDEGEYDE